MMMGTAIGMKRSPQIHLCECDLPQIKDWKVGETYTITMEVEMIGIRKDDMPMMDKNEDMLSADFEVKSITPKGEKTVETEEEDEEEKDEAPDAPKVADAISKKLYKGE